MDVRRLALTILVAAIVSAGPDGCGGGYGGGGGDSYMPMPTVQFTAPAAATTIKLGQAVELSWTTSNATSCTASVSGMTAGAFSGNQSVSGSATVAPTGTGMVTYTLTCTGAGGSASATSPAVSVDPNILSTLSASSIATIGSTLDPIEHGGNPYGLVIAGETVGLIMAGDLIVCNFNDGATNTQGDGTTIIGLHPNVGATPYRVAQSPELEGCNALAILPDGSISAAAFTANADPLVSAAGTVTTPFASDSLSGPWGQVYVPANGQTPAAIYVSDVGGSISRISLNGDAQTAFTTIASGFCGSGVPGAVFAPAGLTYDASIDTLYVVDTSSNSVIALAQVSAIGAGGVVADGQCTSVAAPPTPAPTFSGAAASSARVIAHGDPFIAPISAALLADGDLIVGNGDVNIAAGQTPNLVVEVSPNVPGGFVGQPLQLDTGAPGALFGIATTVGAQGNQIVYFNDDNSNAVMILTQ
jgi:hypothetical protein